jgi:type IV pilus assembly protein PilA
VDESRDMRTAWTTAAAMFAATALAIAGCGEDKPDPQAVKKQDAESKSDARNLVSELEVCFVDNQDYTACKKPPNTKLPLGDGKGQVEVSGATTDGYTVVAHSESGNSFTLKKSGSGAAKRTCDAAGSDEGGCKGGTW